MHVHLVFVTKYRRDVFNDQILNDLRPILAKVCTDFEAELVEFDGEDDHVHLLVNYPPKVSVSALVNSLKGVPSRMIRQKKLPQHSTKTLGPIAMVATVLCGQLWWSTYRGDSSVYGTTANAVLSDQTSWLRMAYTVSSALLDSPSFSSTRER
ncbi:hypothetical protein GCM10027395_07840 [Giesbergeria sinuosa]